MSLTVITAASPSSRAPPKLARSALAKKRAASNRLRRSIPRSNMGNLVSFLFFFLAHLHTGKHMGLVYKSIVSGKSHVSSREPFLIQSYPALYIPRLVLVQSKPLPYVTLKPIQSFFSLVGGSNSRSYANVSSHNSILNFWLLSQSSVTGHPHIPLK